MKENKKKNIILNNILGKKRVLIVLGIIILISIIVAIIFVIADDEQIIDLNPPKDVEIISYDLKEESLVIDVECNVKRIYSEGKTVVTRYFINPEYLADSDSMECYVKYDFPYDIKITDLYYKISFGEGYYFEQEEKPFIGTTIEKDENTELNVTYMYDPTNYEIKYPNGIYKTPVIKAYDTFEEHLNQGKSLLGYSLRIDDFEGDLSIKLEDLVVKTTSGKYYSIPNVIHDFDKSGDSYYIYYDKDKEINVKSSNSQFTIDEHDNIIDTYICSNDYCEFVEYSGDNNFLFKDGEYIIYNSITKERMSLSKYMEHYDVVESAHFDKNKLIGLILCKYVKEKKECGYYLIDEARIITGVNENVCSGDGWINDSTGKLIDKYGNVYKPNINSLEYLYELQNKNIYILNAGCQREEYFYYDEKGNSLFEGNSGELYVTQDNLIFNNIYKKTFSLYDKNFNFIKESKKYDKINFVDSLKNYVVVTEKNSLKAIDYNENIIIEFTTLTKNNKGYAACEKGDYCVVVLDSSITKEQIKNRYGDELDGIDENWDSIKELTAYMYSYNSKTKKLDKSIVLGFEVDELYEY